MMLFCLSYKKNSRAVPYSTTREVVLQDFTLLLDARSLSSTTKPTHRKRNLRCDHGLGKDHVDEFQNISVETHRQVEHAKDLPDIRGRWFRFGEPLLLDVLDSVDGNSSTFCVLLGTVDASQTPVPDQHHRKFRTSFLQIFHRHPLKSKKSRHSGPFYNIITTR